MHNGIRKHNAFAICLTITMAGCTTPPGHPGGAAKGSHPDRGPSKTVVARAVSSIGNWDAMEGVTLSLVPSVKDCPEGHLGVVDAVVKAQHTSGTIAVMATWPDATKSDSHKTLVWNDTEKAYKASSDREDRVAIMFNMEGDFSSCMLDGKTFRADVWHWKAARSDPAGVAHDKYHIYSLKPVHAKSKRFPGPGGKMVYMARISDAGDKLYSSNKPPAAKTDERLPGYVVNMNATGSITDVKVDASHDGAGWTVIMTRKLNTGNKDDVVFEAGSTYRAAIACFDRSGDQHHSTAAFEVSVE